MLYIIDKDKGFKGYCENMLDDNGHVVYGDIKDFEEYKKEKGNENLIAITDKELDQKIAVYRQSLMKEFEEVDEDRYDMLLNSVPPYRMKRRYGCFSFFVGEAYNLDLHDFCFEADGKYYKGLRGIRTSEDKLTEEIKAFLVYSHSKNREDEKDR